MLWSILHLCLSINRKHYRRKTCSIKLWPSGLKKTYLRGKRYSQRKALVNTKDGGSHQPFLVNRDMAATAAELLKPVSVKHLPLALILPFLILRHSHNQSAAGLGTKLPVLTLSTVQKISCSFSFH